jgi:hypothetical protein
MWVYIEYVSIKQESDSVGSNTQPTMHVSRVGDDEQVELWHEGTLNRIRQIVPLIVKILLFPMQSCMSPAGCIDIVADLAFVALIITAAIVDGIVAVVIVVSLHMCSYRLLYLVGTLVLVHRFDFGVCFGRRIPVAFHVVLNLLALAFPTTLWMTNSILIGVTSCDVVSTMNVLIYETCALSLVCSLINLPLLFVKSSFSVGHTVAFFDVDTITITATPVVVQQPSPLERK